ncbi:MAG: hypothetical protein KJN80_06895, partial [Deltaproteobacteria bacterium]|nr:hypothetical protein [Deltaproteobacteria bacterium]
YMTDWNSYSIRKIDTSGIITTIAGNNGYGYAGDGGPATLATLYLPSGITSDSTGNLYFTDLYNFRIRKIDTHRIITTVAGNGNYGSIEDGGPARDAALSLAWGIAIDGQDNMYIATDNTICKVAPQFFIDLYSADGGEIIFAEENNLSHIMSSSGQHIRTLDTGAILHAFGYDADNQIISITDDRFGDISINRDAAGVPISVVSPDGITTLAIDDRNHLFEITYPDGGFYSFEYTEDGLMTNKTDPEGNSFEY